jgi:hypothetical protein
MGSLSWGRILKYTQYSRSKGYIFLWCSVGSGLGFLTFWYSWIAMVVVLMNMTYWVKYWPLVSSKRSVWRNSLPCNTSKGLRWSFGFRVIWARRSTIGCRVDYLWSIKKEWSVWSDEWGNKATTSKPSIYSHEEDWGLKSGIREGN